MTNEKRALQNEKELDEAQGFFAKLETLREYSDEELLAAIIKEARNDCFCGTGRIFVNAFCRWYRCDRERFFEVLKKSRLNWRLGPNESIVLIRL